MKNVILKIEENKKIVNLKIEENKKIVNLIISNISYNATSIQWSSTNW